MLEAQIVCGTGRPTEDLILAAQSEIAHDDDKTRENHKFSLTSLWSSQFPFKLSFSYATIPRRPRRRSQNQRNPFRDPSVSESQARPVIVSEKLPESSSSPPVEEWGVSNMTASPEMLPVDSVKAQIVTPHVVHPTWDDEPSASHPYDIPYYTAPIEDVLWLPRDPLGTLDLDETVDVRTSLTSQPTAGALGAWVDDISEHALSSASLLADEHLSPASAPRELDGTEQIELPAEIEIRINDLKGEDVVESTARTRSLFTRRASSYSTNADRFAPPRPDGISTQPRSFSLGADLNADGVAGPSTLFSSSGRRRRNRSATLDYELGLRSEARLESRSAISVNERRSPSPFLGRRSPLAKGARSIASGSMITAREAVVSEVIMEERQAAEEQLRQDEVEEEKAHEPRSWLTAWMFTKER